MDGKTRKAFIARFFEINDRIILLSNRLKMAIPKVGKQEDSLSKKLRELNLKMIEIIDYQYSKNAEIAKNVKQIKAIRELTLEDEKDMLKQLSDLCDNVEEDLTALEKELTELLKDE